MCESRDGCVVVPRIPTAGVGYFIGRRNGAGPKEVTQLNGKSIGLVSVELLRVQHPEHRGEGLLLVQAENLIEFEDVSLAMAHLQSIGAA